MSCGHKYECGCDKVYCQDCVIAIETDDLEWCDNENCKHYYSYRNDNCNCNGLECGFCNPIPLNECYCEEEEEEEEEEE
jgi:hypothetical protein